MFCRNCGSENRESAKFCIKCRTAIMKRQVDVHTVPKSSFRTNKVWMFLLIFVSILLIGVSYTLFQIWPSTNIRSVTDESPSGEIEKVVKNSEGKQIELGSDEKEKTTIIKESMPKVFTIFTDESLGSGFLYKKGGFIITNAHVVAGYTNVIVRNSDGEDSPAKVIGISDRYDVALLRAKDYVKERPLEIELNESVVGSEVIAIGSPQGFENTATIGYLTGIGRDIDYDFIYENVYQIDAQIDQGSSGGPLIDAKTGKVIGVNSLLYTGNTSFGFSIPMYSLLKLVDQWVEKPMSEREVASLFDVYDEYVYVDQTLGDEIRSYFEEFWGDYDYENDDFDYDYEENGDSYYFVEDDVADFVLDFRDNYEQALYEDDFYWIEDMLYPGSTAYDELNEYMREISGEGMYFDFIENTVTDVSIGEDSAVVSTYEVFEFVSYEGESTLFERKKNYTIVIDAAGYYQISHIDIK